MSLHLVLFRVANFNESGTLRVMFQSNEGQAIRYIRTCFIASGVTCTADNHSLQATAAGLRGSSAAKMTILQKSQCAQCQHWSRLFVGICVEPEYPSGKYPLAWRGERARRTAKFVLGREPAGWAPWTPAVRARGSFY